MKKYQTKVRTTAPMPTGTEDKAAEPQCASHKRKLWNIDGSRWDWHRYCFANQPRIRWAALVGLVIIVLAVMVLSIVFTAEYYTAYYATGAWIISKAGNKTAAQNNASVPILTRHSILDTCDGYLESCAKFNQPSICCPIDTTCYPTKLSTSGIYCCGNSSDCAAGPPGEAVCLLGTTQCGSEQGGGCCKNGMDCSQDGCRVDQPQPSVTDGSSMPEDTVTSEATGTLTYKFGEVAPPSGGVRWICMPSYATAAVLGAAWAAIVLR